jgi:hypothetical protein
MGTLDFSGDEEREEQEDEALIFVLILSTTYLNRI